MLEAKSDPRRHDGEFRGALVYGAALAATSALAYLFNAVMGRRLSAQDFGTLGALIATMLVLSGPVSALYGGAAMSSARSGKVARLPWQRWLALAATGAALAALLPLSPIAKAGSWFVLAACAWMIVSWNRGLLIGLGRLSLVGGSTIFEGSARLAIAVLLVTRGWAVAGAAGGFALGTVAAVILTEVLLPRHRKARADSPDRGASTAALGLLFVSLAQFPDVVAIRVLSPTRAGAYTAASSLARIALYAQAPAAAYAIRRGAVAGTRRSIGRTLLLATGPGAAAVIVLELVARPLLRVTYGGRYLQSVRLIEILAIAMFFEGLALVLIYLMMGAGKVNWARPAGIVAVIGVVVVFAFARTPTRVALALVAVQASLLGLATFLVVRQLARPPHHRDGISASAVPAVLGTVPGDGTGTFGPAVAGGEPALAEEDSH